MALTHEEVAAFLAASKSPVQLVKHFDEVPDSKKVWPMYLQLKKDGVYCLVVIIDGTTRLYSRTGNEFYKRTTDFVESVTESLHDGVYIAELCNPAFSLEEFSGMISTNRKKDWHDADAFLMNSTQLFFHDYINLDDLLNGRCDLTYEQRYNELRERLAEARCPELIIPYILVNSADEVHERADALIEVGEEGIVVKQDCPWVAGHKGFHAMKVVRSKHVDLRCVGVEYGKGKRAGQIAKLEFNYFGHTFFADLGKGWTDVRRAALTEAYELKWTKETTPSGEINPIGQVWELYSLQESSTGKALRLPKAWRVREDKDLADDEVDELIK